MPIQSTLQAKGGVLTLDTSESELSDVLSAILSPGKRAADDELSGHQSKRRDSRKRGITHHKTWSYARVPRPGDPDRDRHGHKLWYCSRCDNTGIPTMRRAREHLLVRHHIRITEDATSQGQALEHTIQSVFGRQIVRQQGRNVEQESLLRDAVNKEAFQKALARILVIHNLPHRLVESPHLRALPLTVNYMASDVLVGSHSSVPAIVQQTFLEQKATIKSKLQMALGRVHFSVDMWSAPSKTGYQAIVAHFIDSSSSPPQLAKALIALREHKGSHGGREQASVFLDVVREYQIQDQIGYFTMDNATSNDKMLRYIAEELPEFDAVKQRVRCSGHVINLAVQAFLFAEDPDAVDEAVRQLSQLAKDELKGRRPTIETAQEFRRLGALGRVHNTVNHMRTSDTRYNEFKEAAGRSIPRDNSTRWNSWYLMLHVFLQLRVHVNQYQDRYYNDLQEDIISRDDWQELQAYHDFLKPFYDITQAEQLIQQPLTPCSWIWTS